MKLDRVPLRFTVPPQGRDMRLDAVLAFALPDLGLRGRRRLWEWCRVCVNGRRRPPGFSLAGGEEIVLTPLAHATPPASPSLRLVGMNADFLALHKPCGMHSARLAGGRAGAASLEDLLLRDWERFRHGELAERSEHDAHAGHDDAAPPERPPLLLTRLDEATSGIVLAARSEEAAARFRLMEKEGRVAKDYFALLKGRLEQGFTVKNRLLTDKRPLTLVLDEDDPDPARHSLVTPLCEIAGPATLALVRIKRGARHQIRAHLAHAGFPLAGEWLYPAPSPREAGTRLYLHHAKVEFAGFTAQDMPGWGTGEACLLQSKFFLNLSKSKIASGGQRG